MISAGQNPTYFNTDVISYTCISGYMQENEREITCTCDVENIDNWSCSISVVDFANECVRG